MVAANPPQSPVPLLPELGVRRLPRPGGVLNPTFNPAPAFPLIAPPASPRSALFRAFVEAGLQPGAFALVVARLQIRVSSFRQLTPLECALPQNSPATSLQ